MAEKAIRVVPRDERTAPQQPGPATQPIAPPPATKPEASVPPAAARPKRSRKFLILAGIGLVLVLAGGLYGFRWWTVGRFIISTDDAYVQADVTPLVAKVSGYIAAIRVKDNAEVRAGDLLAEIDPGDYRLAVQTAKDRIAAQSATIDRLAAQITADAAIEAQAEASLASTQAVEKRAIADFTRAETLTARAVGSRQALDAARAARDTATAGVASARAALAQAKANMEVTRAQQKEATAALQQLNTALASAERDLSFAAIRAPADGTVGNRAVNVGSYVSVGSRVMALVPAGTLYVAANFKETQLASIRQGQAVQISVDAADGASVTGHVDSIAPASGSVFSLLPVENATGNFTKIVQRVPVRIAVAPADAKRLALRPGLSVVAEIDTRTGPGGAQAAP